MDEPKPKTTSPSLQRKGGLFGALDMDDDEPKLDQSADARPPRQGKRGDKGPRGSDSNSKQPAPKDSNIQSSTPAVVESKFTLEQVSSKTAGALEVRTCQK